MVKLRRYLLSGIAVALPIILTVYLIIIIFRFADGILGNFINLYLEKRIGHRIPGLGLFLSFLIILLTGYITSNFLGKRLLLIFEKLLLRMPFIKQIYPAAKQIVNFLVSKDKPAFRKVVMVEYPRKGVWSVGFVTNEGLKEAQEKTNQELICVFIPGSPGPFTGYFIFAPKNEVIFLNLSIEDGLKLIVSGGIWQPESNK